MGPVLTGPEAEVAEAEHASATPVQPERRGRAGGRARARLDRVDGPTLVLWVAVPLSVVVLLVLSRHQWFRGDEFGFLVDRRRLWGAGERLEAVLDPHNEHWTTTPFLLFMGLFRIVRFTTYLPYLLMLYVFHVVLALALRALLVRTGTGAWLATGAAVLMLLLGSGMENLLWAFQMGFVGGVALGLVALVLSDHDGPLGRRDVLGVAVLVTALTFSATALTMVVVVAVNALCARRWSALAAYTGTATVVFGLWYATYGRSAARMEPSADRLASYVWRGLANAADDITQLQGAGAVLIVAAVVSLTHRAHQGRLPGAIVATSAGSAVFFALAGFARTSLGVEQAEDSRYVYVAAALLLPALVGLLSDLVEANGRAGAVVAAGFLAWAVVANVLAGTTFSAGTSATTDSSRTRLAATAALASFRSLAPEVRPEPVYTPNVDIAALQDLIDHDRLQLPAVTTAQLLAAAAEVEVRAGTGRAGDPDLAALRGVAGTTLAAEDGCVRLRNPAGGVVVHAISRGRADLVVTDAEGPLSARVLSPAEPLAAPSSQHGAYLLLDHTDFPVEIRLPSPQALVCGAHIEEPSA